MAHLRLGLLGPLQIVAADGGAPRFAYEKVRALLVYLALERHRPHRREALAELLWPGQPPESGRASLRQALTSLRQTLPVVGGAPLLVVTRDTVQLNPAGPYWLDATAFAELLAACEAHPHDSAAGCASCGERYAAATALYRGALADDLVVPGCPEFDEWLHLKREQFAGGAGRALLALADHAEARGETARALASARSLLALDPWSDPVHLRVMRLLAAGGEPARALEHYRRYRRQLRDELGLEPAAELAALHDHLLAVAAQPPGPPPHGMAPVAYPLPRPATSLIGREAELAELVALVHTPDCRLLTLVGPGGIGKTRLALRLAESACLAFPQGVCWVALADVVGVEQLAYAVARALSPAYSDRQDPREHLRAFLQGRQLLLVLDGFEQLLDGAELLSELLACAPRLKLLVTSRERLRVGWEWLYTVPGLAFPGEHAAAEEGYSAVELLLARLRQGGSVPQEGDRAALGRIARLTQGMPLALELAAAALRRHSPADVVASLAHTSDLLRTTLRDVPERHRSMRAALEHSWRQLRPDEQLALARLSVFRESCAPDAALAVARADAELLENMADKSLLQHSGGRYAWHELTRQFAHEQLRARGGELEACGAQLAFYAELAAQAAPHLTGEQQEHWLGRLEVEHAAIRAALAWGSSHEPEGAARLAGTLWRFWWMRGHVREGRAWLERALARGDGLDAATRAQLLKGAGGLAYVQGDYAVARRHQEAALQLERAHGSTRALASALHNLALTVSAQGDPARAASLLEEARAIHRGLGNATGVALVLDGLAEVATERGDYARAHEYLRQSLALHQARGDDHSAGVTRLNLANLALLRGEAASLAGEAAAILAVFRAFGSTQGIAVSLHLRGKVALRAGDLVGARAALAEALTYLNSDELRQDLAACLVSLAALAGREGDWKRAARVAGVAMGLSAHEGGRLMPPESFDYERTIAEARQALGLAAEAPWAAGYELGRAGPLRSILESLALDAPPGPAEGASATPQGVGPAQATLAFGPWVRRRRERLGLTRPELARRLGCSREMVGKIEAERRRPSPGLAERLALQLEIAPDERAAFLLAAQGPPGARLPGPDKG
jgi:DNA-binding SARP family transcriptional activator/predicted ATPase/DNA-binding XRE family transcriptional regulator/predicted negative regulator of RcsB-dependent stress response